MEKDLKMEKELQECYERQKEKNLETLLYVESYVLLTALLIAFLTVFGSWRRRSHSLKLKYSIWASYLLSTNLINYTMGLMKSATFRNEFYSVWATFLVIFVGSADCISAYSLEDSENRKRYNLELLVLYFWLGWLIAVQTIHKPIYMIPLYLLYLLSLRRTGGKAKALELASKSYGLMRNTKVIADFMEDERHKEGDEEDPTCMKGYKYLVKGEKKAKVKVEAPHYHMQFETTGDRKVITIEMIWQCKGRLLSSTGDPDGRLKDICLSYALYRLLCRRFAKYSFPESSQLKTWNFVRYGLLSKEGDHERAFRVIELELGFLYDLFYTKYPVLFDKGLPLLRNFEFLIVIIGFWVAVPILASFRKGTGDLYFMTTGGHNVDVRLTGIVLVAILFMEIVQFLVVNFSDWAKVQWLCYYVEKPSWQNNTCMEMILRVICLGKLLKPWDRKLSQYSLLESFSHNPSKLLYNRCTSPYIDKPRNGLKLSAHVKLPMGVKKAIIHSLKTNGRRLTNGVASLQRNEVNVPSWARELPTQTHVIMVWHIATSLCELNLSSQIIVTREQVNQQRESEDFIVATKLSKYCAYLVAFAPRLLPDHPYITEFIFDHVVVEARKKLEGCKKSICQKLFTLSKDDRKEIISKEMLTSDQKDDKEIEEIIEKGAVLAKDLIGKIKDNGRRWKILAELWAEMMLFVAPSDDETAHAEHLAMGGEFVTHLWALLSHAGILKRDSAHDV